MIDNNTYVVDGIYNRPSGPTVQESGNTQTNQGGGAYTGTSKPVYGGGGGGSASYPAFSVVELVNDYTITDEEGNEQLVERKITATTPNASLKLKYDTPVFIDIDDTQQLVFSIKEDKEHRFVADFKIKEWDNKADRIHYHKGEDITSGTIYLERIPDLPDTKIIGLSQFIREMKNALKNIYTKNEVDSKIDTLYKQLNQQIEEVRKLVGSGISNTVWKESVPTYSDILTTYPNPEDGWTVNVMDTDYTYRWTGTEWIVISANAIPIVSYEQSGLMSSQDKITLDNISSFSKYFYYDAERDMVVCDKSVGSLRDFVAYLSAGDLPSIWDSLPIATAGNASATKGIASFNASFFTVSSGYVSLRSDLDFGLNESQLAAYLTSNNYAKKTDKVAAATMADTATSAGTANSLTTARTLWGQSFNGTANVSGAISSTGNITPTTTNTSDIGSSTLRYRNIYGNVTGALTGNASTASKLITPRTISLTGAATGSTSFDGSANASIAVTVLKLSNPRTIWGQSFNGTANITGAMSGVTNINTLAYFNGANLGIGTSTPRTKLDVAGNIYATGDVVAYRTSDYDPSQEFPKASKTSYGWVKIGDNITVVDGVISANAGGLDEAALANYLTSNNYAKKTDNVASASKLLTARTIALSGAITGSGSFDGSGNLTIPTTFAQNFDTKYVLKTGDTMSGVLNVVSIKSTNNFDSARINMCLAAFNFYALSVTGTIKITLPFSWTNSMNVYRIVVYEYNSFSASEIIIGGYDYNDGARWVNFGYSVLGDYNKGVRLAHDGSKTCILLGTTSTVWNYPAVFLDTVYTSYSGSVNNNWSKGYSISLITSESGYTNIAIPSEKMDAKFVKKSGDTMSGYLTVPGVYFNDINVQSDIRSQNSSYLHYSTSATSGHLFNKTVHVQGELYAGPGYNQKVWHAGNDGAGSGLDADLLDGHDSTAFFRNYISVINNGDINTFKKRYSGTYMYNYPGAAQMLTSLYIGHGSCSSVEILSTYTNTHKIRTTIDDGRYSDWADLLTSINYGTYIYGKTEADNRFVNVTGDTMSGHLIINKTLVDPAIWAQENGANKGAFGWRSVHGTYIYNPKGGHYLGILDNGNPHFDTYTLYHENNAGNFYSWSQATRNSYQTWDLSNTSTYNVNTYYPVTIALAPSQVTRNEIIVALDSGTKPSWSTHNSGFSVRLIWEENGNAWGVIPIYRKIISATYIFADQSPIGGITQLSNSSTCVVWLRGGGRYYYYSNGQRPKGGPYTTQQTIKNQTFNTRTLDEAAQGWADITKGWEGSEMQFIWQPNIAYAMHLYGDNNVGANIFYYWNGRNKNVGNWTSRIYEAASGRLSIPGKLAVGAAGVNDSYALSATSFYSSGNIIASGYIQSTSRIISGYDNSAYWISAKSLIVSGSSVHNGGISTTSVTASAASTFSKGLSSNSTLYMNDAWIYTKGAYGWYNSTYEGGIYMNDTSYVRIYNNKNFRVNGLISCGEAQDDTYGYMNVTRPNNNNYCCYAFVRSGIEAFGIGFTTNNTIWIGKPNASRILASQFMDISSSQVRISGNLIANGEVTAYSTSDIRLKKNITDITTEEATNILSKIRPVTYEWNDKAFELNAEQRYKGRETGLIAQELQAVLPCAIKTVFTDYYSIDYTRLIPPIIKVVNKHEAEIKHLKARIKQLEKQLECRER